MSSANPKSKISTWGGSFYRYEEYRTLDQDGCAPQLMPDDVIWRYVLWSDLPDNGIRETLKSDIKPDCLSIAVYLITARIGSAGDWSAYRGACPLNVTQVIPDGDTHQECIRKHLYNIQPYLVARYGHKITHTDGKALFPEIDRQFRWRK